METPKIKIGIKANAAWLLRQIKHGNTTTGGIFHRIVTEVNVNDFEKLKTYLDEQGYNVDLSIKELRDVEKEDQFCDYSIYLYKKRS